MKLNNRGFGAVEILLFVVIVGILGFVGYRAYIVYTSDPETGSEQSKYEFKDGSVNNTAADQYKEVVKFLTIAEWAVKFPLPASTGLKYSLKNNGSYEYAQLHSTLLDKYPENCSDTVNTVGIYRGKTPDDREYGGGKLIKKIGDYYYYSIHPQSTCSNDGVDDQLMVNTDVTESVKKLESTE